MHVRLLFPNKYLGAPDLKGKDVHLTIHTLTSESLRTDKGDEQKWVLHFAEMQQRPESERKRLVLNKTNAGFIAKALGETDTESWIGRRITLYATTCQAFGATVDCVRVRTTAPKQREQARPPERDAGQDEGDAWEGGLPGDDEAGR